MTAPNLDPIATSDAISRDYRRYLNSLLPLRDPVLGGALQACIDSTSVLTKGPFLEATPPYRSGSSIRDLIDEGVLPKGFSSLASDEMPQDRPLYVHQERALRKVASGRNVVVATGTGSGKTESFLLPILGELAREKAAGTLGPGIRALLLYPMNALANDQIKRLRRLLASTPEFTFGRYVGDTPYTTRDAEARFEQLNPGEPRLPNELLSREEMQANPPQVLLTNYAMLEYLLLRPQDMDLFEGDHAGTWKFLIVDEAHVYDGARGSELAMLLRRLRDRVAGGADLTCIATSATVGADTNPASVTTFATNLFGSSFEWVAGDETRQDLVVGERHPIPGGLWGPLTGAGYREIASSENIPAAMLKRCPPNIAAQGAAAALATERAMATARTMLSTGVATLGSVAARLGADWEPADLPNLVTVGAHVKDASGVPVLSGRYHQWIRAVEGAFTCLHPTTPHVSLARREQCEECERPVYELAACTRCGTPYILGRETTIDGHAHLEPRATAWGSRTWLALTESPSEPDEDDDAWDEAADGEQDAIELCTECGVINVQGAKACGRCGKSDLRAARIAATHAAQMKGCVSCESRTPSDVRQLDTGQDASTSVVATSLYQHLPEAGGDDGDLPGGGRKLLIFSDSRQGAAYFAPYLEGTYQKLLQRRLLLRGARTAQEREGGPALIDDAIAAACDEATRYGLFARRDSRQSKLRTIGLWLAQELVAMDERQSLEGLGLVRLEIDEPDQIRNLAVWQDIGLTPDQGVGLVTELLRKVRRQGAVTMPPEVDPADESFAPRLGPSYIRERGADAKLFAWAPTARLNSRLDFVARVLARAGSNADPAKVLAGIWRVLTTGEDPRLRPLSHRKHGPVFQVDYHWLRAMVLGEGDTLYRCTLCKRWSSIDVVGACPGYRCEGTLEPITIGSRTEDDNHYRALYRDLTPISMSVKEHTAQWRAEQAAEIQMDFLRGKVNALSCSTTFELGVDVGELQAVLLKNVPPRTANYVQRAGRAGRRTASAALVVTMAQRRSHDLTQYASPEKMIAGEVSAPVIPLGNARIDRRHGHSVVFSRFFREAFVADGSLWRYSGDFFYPEGASKSAIERVEEYIKSHETQLAEELRRTLPPAVLAEIDVVGGSWITHLIDALKAVEAEVRQEIDYFEDARKEAFDTRNDRLASAHGRVIKTLRERPLLGFLGSRNILPKYGFPTDVVELKTSLTQHREGLALDLNRDLSSAIYEYAPGSQIVAGGLVWTSAGVYTLPSKDLVAGFMAECTECGFFERDLKQLDGVCPQCAGNRKVHEYVVPEFGFIAAREATRPGRKPPERSRSGATHHLGGGQPTSEPILTHLATGGTWERMASERARMVAVSTGANSGGFVLCEWCGRGWSAARGGFKKSHDHAWKDEKCTGRTRLRWLAHQFETDVLTIKPSDPTVSEEAMWSTLYALLEGAAEHLHIARDDIDGTISRSKAGIELVLFDTVPGGAGGVLRVSDEFDSILPRALRVVDDCECGEETSCYSCLRSYGNQSRHELLSRGAAADLLRTVVT